MRYLSILGELAGYRQDHIARKARVSPATLKRYLEREGDVTNPHSSHVSGVFDGVKIIGDTLDSQIS